MWPVYVSQHRCDDIQREQTKGVGQKPYTGDYNHPYLKGRGIDCGQCPSPPSYFLTSLSADDWRGYRNRAYMNISK